MLGRCRDRYEYNYGILLAAGRIRERIDLVGTDHPAITEYWQRFFNNAEFSARPGAKSLKLIDIGSGVDIALKHAFSRLVGPHLNPFCIDLSPAAVKSVCKRWPSVSGVIANAQSLPLVECSADIVCSQFGIEYAGVSAIYSALASVKCGGCIALINHHRVA